MLRTPTAARRSKVYSPSPRLALVAATLPDNLPAGAKLSVDYEALPLDAFVAAPFFAGAFFAGAFFAVV